MNDRWLPPCRDRRGRGESSIWECLPRRQPVLPEPGAANHSPSPAEGGAVASLSPRQMSWRLGLTTTARDVPTLAQTLASLERSGWPRPRLFVDGPLDVPGGHECSYRLPAIGAWPNWLLGLAELVVREPAADAYVMLQDDVLFAARVRQYLEARPWPADAGVVSIFCPRCYNGPAGFNRVPSGYGLSGAQTLIFPREAAYAFLGHPWVANHRRHAPRGPHFRGDGLCHIDGAVGQWAALVRKPVYFHYPSLARHIGHSSVMYPGFTGKGERRWDDSFVGESFSWETLIHANGESRHA